MNDWRYNRTTRCWELTLGDWRATVARTESRKAWHTAIERLGSYHERVEGPDVPWPHEGRAWCEAEIARRRVDATSR